MNDRFEDLMVRREEEEGERGSEYDGSHEERDVQRSSGCLSMAVVAAVTSLLAAGVAHELSSPRKWIDYENLRASLEEVTTPVVQELDRLLGDNR